MYNRILDTFIAVADSGSFTKAADSLYISPTAVMKQMNTLEKDLNLVLMERTPLRHLSDCCRCCHLSGRKIYN